MLLSGENKNKICNKHESLSELNINLLKLLDNIKIHSSTFLALPGAEHNDWLFNKKKFVNYFSAVITQIFLYILIYIHLNPIVTYHKNVTKPESRRICKTKKKSHQRQTNYQNTVSTSSLWSYFAWFILKIFN